MNIFDNLQETFSSQLLKSKINSKADEIFGFAGSYLKNLWINKEYIESGGVFEKIEDLNYQDYRYAKGSIEVSYSQANNWIVNREYDFAESFLNDEGESIANLAIDAIQDIEVLFVEKFKKSSFNDVYAYRFKEMIAKKEDEKVDEAFKKYHDTVNMSASELQKWSENECSKKASLSRAPIKRNLHLLKMKKDDWGKKETTWANKTIAFVARMKKVENGKPVSKDCPSKKVISLKNWAYDPNK